MRIRLLADLKLFELLRPVAVKSGLNERPPACRFEARSNHDSMVYNEGEVLEEREINTS
jgi:hypothetical protein